jgi:hypothetical protein
MQAKTLWQFELLSEIDSFNTTIAARLQLNSLSERYAQQLSLKLLPFGKSTQLVFNAEKAHTIKPYDFPVTLYFDLVLQDQFMLNVHELQPSLKNQGFFYKLSSSESVNSKYIEPEDLAHLVGQNTSLSSLMREGTYTLFNELKEEVAICEPPFNQVFSAILNENYGIYYFSTTESDMVERLAYTPKPAKNTFAVLALSLAQFDFPKKIEQSLTMKSRPIQIRYNFLFRNSSENLKCSFHNKIEEVSFNALGEKVLFNGQTALKYESVEFQKFDEIERNQPYYVMLNQNVEYDGLNSYQLPEKFYLPNIDKRSIKADGRGYFIEQFITI